MIGHQRDILATLGIDLWIPRDSACQPHQVSIWRDQAAPEFHSDIVLPQSKQPEVFTDLSIPEPVIQPEADCSIVIDATAMTEETQNLWTNIQRAVVSEFCELNWPFPWANVQDGRGVDSYIQGFLDGMSAEKNIIFLGTVPYISNSKIIQLASLQEMLDQPILKKRLWQFMQNRSASLK